MKGFFSVALAAVMVLGLTSCSQSSDDPNNPNRVEGSYGTEYIQVTEGNVIKCLWHNKRSKSGSFTCDWNYAGEVPADKDLHYVEGSYKTEFIEVDGEVIECLWYSKGSQSGAMDCDWS